MVAVQIGVVFFVFWVFESCIMFSDCPEERTAFFFSVTEVMPNMYLLPKRRNIWLRGVETQNWPPFKEIFYFQYREWVFVSRKYTVISLTRLTPWDDKAASLKCCPSLRCLYFSISIICTGVSYTFSMPI